MSILSFFFFPVKENHFPEREDDYCRIVRKTVL